MRVIKFRAWLEQTKTMFMDVGGHRYFPFRYHKEYIIMQFTGLKDKNGKEIYEGDIVKTFEGVMRVIEWDEACAYFRFSDMDCTLSGELNEVVGNVWENPKVLKSWRIDLP